MGRWEDGKIWRIARSLLSERQATTMPYNMSYTQFSESDVRSRTTNRRARAADEDEEEVMESLLL